MEIELRIGLRNLASLNARVSRQDRMSVRGGKPSTNFF